MPYRDFPFFIGQRHHEHNARHVYIATAIKSNNTPAQRENSKE